MRPNPQKTADLVTYIGETLTDNFIFYAVSVTVYFTFE